MAQVWDQEEGSCENGNEHSGSIQLGQFLDKISVILASQKRFCSMEFSMAGSNAKKGFSFLAVIQNVVTRPRFA